MSSCPPPTRATQIWLIHSPTPSLYYLSFVLQDFATDYTWLYNTPIYVFPSFTMRWYRQTPHGDKMFEVSYSNFIKSSLSNGSLMGPSFSLFNQFILLGRKTVWFNQVEPASWVRNMAALHIDWEPRDSNMKGPQLEGDPINSCRDITDWLTGRCGDTKCWLTICSAGPDWPRLARTVWQTN